MTKKREKPPRGVAGAPGRSGPRPDHELLEEALARPDGWIDDYRAAASAVARRVMRRAERDEDQHALDRGMLEGLATSISSHEALMKRRGSSSTKAPTSGAPSGGNVVAFRSALVAGAPKPPAPKEPA